MDKPRPGVAIAAIDAAEIKAHERMDPGGNDRVLRSTPCALIFCDSRQSYRIFVTLPS
jgi:hypothetical protein